MAAKILPSPVSYEAYLKEPLINSMFLTPTNEIEIKNIIAELNQTKSTCLSDLPVDIIKRSAVSISFPLTHLNATNPF